MHFEKMSPYELGETKKSGAVPYLIIYLKIGTDNEKRLAASAIRKLIPYAKQSCQKAIPYLIQNLKNPKPQVRHYTLKTLKEFDLAEDYFSIIQEIVQKDDKLYNQELATDILKRFARYQPGDEYLPHEETEETNHGKGYVYFIQEDYAGRVKIGKTKNIETRMNTFDVKLPFNVTLLHYIFSNNHHYTEKLFHIHFRHKQVNGEWFELDDLDIEWIKNGKYTKRIEQSILQQPKPFSRPITVKPTEKQILFLQTLLNDNEKELICPIQNLSIEQASDLISYLYKGIEPDSSIKSLLLDSSNRA